MKFKATQQGLTVVEYSCTTSIRESYISQWMQSNCTWVNLGPDKCIDIARAMVYLANEPCAVSVNLANGMVVSKTK